MFSKKSFKYHCSFLFPRISHNKNLSYTLVWFYISKNMVKSIFFSMTVSATELLKWLQCYWYSFNVLLKICIGHRTKCIHYFYGFLLYKCLEVRLAVSFKNNILFFSICFQQGNVESDLESVGCHPLDIDMKERKISSSL